jgi:hypothetical protein
MNEAVLEKLATAIADVSAAEGDLAKLLRAMAAAPRAQKKIISMTVEDALARLNLARDALLELKVLIADEP